MQTTLSLRQIAYTPEQQAAIDRVVGSPKPSKQYAWSDRLAEFGNGVFGVFGSLAYKCPEPHTDEGDFRHLEIIPVTVDGRMLYVSDEDGSGVCVQVRITILPDNLQGNWICAFSDAEGWLYTRELDEPVEDVNRRIMDEGSHITGPSDL